MPTDKPLRILDDGMRAATDPSRLLDGRPGYQVSWEVAIMEGHRHVLKPEREAPHDNVRAFTDLQPGGNLGRGRDAGHLTYFLPGPLALLERLGVEPRDTEAAVPSVVRPGDGYPDAHSWPDDCPASLPGGDQPFGAKNPECPAHDVPACPVCLG